MRTCEHCEAENDDTRVFCANCGTRLPERGSSTPSEPAGRSEPTAPPAVGSSAPPLPGGTFRKSKKPAKALASGDKGVAFFFLSSLFWMAVVSATLATVIQMVRSPDNIPSPVGINTSAAHETFSTLEDLAASPKAISWTLNSKAINQFLETTIEMKPGSSGNSNLSARFQRAFVILRKGSLALCVDQKFMNANLYFLLEVEPVITDSGLGAKPVGGAIGRMPVHPVLLPVFLRLFEPTISGLAQPLNLLRKAKSVAITPDDATLQWSGTGNQTQP